MTDQTAEVLIRRNGELRRQRDAAVKDNKRLRERVTQLKRDVNQAACTTIYEDVRR